MKPRLAHLLPLLCLLSLAVARADSHLTPGQSFAYGANTGWIDLRAGSGFHGVRIGPSACAGFAWSATTGWINLGSGQPANGVHYANTTGEDSGVNREADGRLRGLAWSASLGWINFENTGDPRLDPATLQILGRAWSATTGWISFETPQTQLVLIDPDTDKDGIPDAWERRFTKNLGAIGFGDADHDGHSDLDEYAADTHPLDPASRLEVVNFHPDYLSATFLEWTSRPTRRYRLEQSDALSQWSVSTALPENAPALALPGAAAATTARAVVKPPADRAFFRVVALPPPAGE